MDAAARVNEVIVHIGYDNKTHTLDDLYELRDFTEAIVGTEFQIEQAHVDMRIRPFGPLDESTEPLYIRIIAQHQVDKPEQERVSKELQAQLTQHFHEPFRLWVEFADATFTEVTN